MASDFGPMVDLPIVLSVFWCGTSSRKEGRETQIQLFYEWCAATDLTNPGIAIDEHTEGGYGILHHQEELSSPQYKLIVDGCGVAFGMTGTIWGVGLHSQADVVCDRIAELRGVYGSKRKIILNLLGLSRGGVACFVLAKKLVGEDPLTMDVNILAFDPVPGNFVATARFDFFGLTNAWGNMDLTKCEVVKSALVLYPHEPLPDMAVHAPMIPRFHPKTSAVYDVILGCHQGAMWNAGGHRSLDTWLSGFIIRNFLTSHGTSIDFLSAVDAFNPYTFELLIRLNDAILNPMSSVRTTHSYGSVTIHRTPGRIYLNMAHFLLQKMEDDGDLQLKRLDQPYLYDYAPPPYNSQSIFTLHFSEELCSGRPETDGNSPQVCWK